MIVMALILINFDIPAGIPLAQQMGLLSKQAHVNVLFDYEQLTREIGRTPVRGPHTVQGAACMLTQNTRNVPTFQFLKSGGVDVAIWSLDAWAIYPGSSAPAPKWEVKCAEMLQRPKSVSKETPVDEPTLHECICPQSLEGIPLRGPWCRDARNELLYVPACRVPTRDMLPTGWVTTPLPPCRARAPPRLPASVLAVRLYISRPPK